MKHEGAIEGEVGKQAIYPIIHNVHAIVSLSDYPHLGT